MQDSIDRQRLLRQFGRDPAHPALVIAIYLIGFLILLAIVSFGVYAPASDADAPGNTRSMHDINTVLATSAAATPQGFGVCIGRSYAVVPGYRLPVSELVAGGNLHCDAI